MAESSQHSHGYIVETAAEKRLRLASKALNSPVWLTRKIADADGSETMMLSCYTPGDAAVSHHTLVQDENGAVGLHGRRMYPDLHQFVTAFQDSDAGSPAPLGSLVAKNAPELWKTKMVEIAASQPTELSVDTNARQLFKCPMCLFADSAIDVFIKHLENSHTEDERNEMRHRQPRNEAQVARLGAHVHLMSATGINLGAYDAGAALSGLFVRLVYKCMRRFQSTVVYGTSSPDWDQHAFIAANTSSDWRVSDDLMLPLTIELWLRGRNSVDVLYASGDFSLADLQRNEAKQASVQLSPRSNIVNEPVVIEFEFGMGRENVSQAEDQSVGATRSHRSVYRTRKANCAKQKLSGLGNQLVGRLSKLLFEGPAGNSARKAYEKTLVPWIKDSLVPKCPDCGSGFGMSNRRHHCRLCGGVVCKQCSRALDAEESASLVREVYGARRRKNPADMTALVSDGDIRVCSNCCQVCESEHGNAMKYKNIREVLKSTGEAMTVSGTYYEVLQKGLQKLRADVATFNELATKLRRFEGISEYDRASAMRTQALTDFTTQDKLSKKLIVSAEGQFFSVFVKIHVHTVGVLQELLCSLEDLPPLELIMSLMAQRKKIQHELSGPRKGDDIFELYEVQRHHSSTWFSGNALLDDDWQPWSSADGSWGYLTKSSVNPRSGFQWQGSWIHDYGAGDEDGWVYATELSANPRVWEPEYNRDQHQVRRRRFYRRLEPIVVRIRAPTSPAVLLGRRTSSMSQRTPATISRSATIQDDMVGSPSPELSVAGSPIAAGTPPPLSNTVAMASLASAKTRTGSFRSDSAGLGTSPANGPKRSWIANGAASKCMLCEKSFTKLKRKHHCRHCGRVVCAACSNNKMAHEEFQDKKKDMKNGVRTCDQCFLLPSASGGDVA